MSTQQDRNPSPPAPDELDIDPELLRADNIGDTVFSKRWVFATLMKLLKEVEKEPEGKTPQELDAAKAHGMDIDEGLETDLCKLWDMTANQDVANFLHEWKSPDILTSVIEQTTAPRVTEISMGILANMACSKEIAGHLSSQDKIRALTLDFLESSDTQTLIQTTRLLLTCLSSKLEDAVALWLQQITPENNQRLAFILKSSTNVELLYNVGFTMSTLFALDEAMVQDWTDKEQIVSIIEALKQVRASGRMLGSTSGQSRTISLLLSCLEIIVADDDGMTNLVLASDEVLPSLGDFLWSFCEEEVVTVYGSEGSLASTIYIIEVVMANMEGANDIVDTLRKYPKLLKGAVEIFASLYWQKVTTEKSKTAAPTKQRCPTEDAPERTDGRQPLPSSGADDSKRTETDSTAKSASDCEGKVPTEPAGKRIEKSTSRKPAETDTPAEGSSSATSSNSQSASMQRDAKDSTAWSVAFDNQSGDHSDGDNREEERKELSENLSSFFVFLLREAGGSTSQSQVAGLLRDACGNKHKAVLRQGMAQTTASPEIQQLLAATLGEHT